METVNNPKVVQMEISYIQLSDALDWSQPVNSQDIKDYLTQGNWKID